MRRTILAAALAAALTATVASAAPSTARRQQCTLPCRAAYAAIARALPQDRENTLARAILGTPHFDYPQLAKAMRIPTPAQIRRWWRRYCNAQFAADSRAAFACFQLILGPPGGGEA
ncbi:MAG TPA: hypothetical protein VNH40_11130 [Gaiellaceae bacterium]|nr:hypothetical protein [Gaiellaceae bacterium]